MGLVAPDPLRLPGHQPIHHKNRDYLKRLEGETERERFAHLIFDRCMEVIGDEKL